MSPARRACCNQWLRTGNYQSHVEQISPDKDMNFQCTTAAFTVSHEPEGFVIFGSLAQRLSLVCDFCPSARTFALRLPPHRPSRDCTCLKLVVVISRRLYRQSNVGSPTGDFHPISSCPCRAYQKIPADTRSARAAEFGVMCLNSIAVHEPLNKAV